MDHIDFSIPPGLDERFAAQTFAAYLLGSRAFQNGDGRLGPFFNLGKWQLDQGNDFYLRALEGNRVRLGCRYPTQHRMLVLMMEMFLRRYAPDRLSESSHSFGDTTVSATVMQPIPSS